MRSNIFHSIKSEINKRIVFNIRDNQEGESNKKKRKKFPFLYAKSCNDEKKNKENYQKIISDKRGEKERRKLQ